MSGIAKWPELDGLGHFAFGSMFYPFNGNQHMLKELMKICPRLSPFEI
jgi:hypothetical protein